MIAFEVFLTWVAVCLYFANAVLSWVALLWQREKLLRWSQGLLAAGLLVHAVPVVERWIRIGHGPYISAFEVLSASVLAGLAALFLLSLRWPTLRWATAPSLSAGILLLGWGVLSNPEVQPLPPTFRSIWLVVHVIAAKLAFGAILVASGAAAVYLVRVRGGRARRDGEGAEAKNQRLSSGLDVLSYRLLAFGFVFVGFMITAGSIWARDAWGSYWSWDPLETWSLITWVAYGLALHLRRTLGLRGRGWAWTILGLFCLSVFSFFVAALVVPTIHTEFMES